MNHEELLEKILATVSDVRSELTEIRDRLAGTHKDLMTVDELARLVGRAPYTVRSWIKDGKIRAERVTGTGPRGRLLIGHDELRKLVALGKGSEMPPV